MEKIAENIFVDSEMSSSMRTVLLESHRQAEKNVQLIYGEMLTNPVVVACSTDKCFRRFGGVSARAKSFADRALLLSPRGLNSHILSHELSHNELYYRISSFFHWRKIPQWFDEGLAVVVSDEPSHSTEAWNEIRRKNITTPAMAELVSLRDWFNAIDKYGEHRATPNNPDKLKIVYATAGNEVRQWYQCVGNKGLLDLISTMKTGGDFSETYNNLIRTQIDNLENTDDLKEACRSILKPLSKSVEAQA